eukprot:6701746-Prymnesium_polylepis.1
MDVIVLILTRRGDGEVRPARSSPQEANLPGKRDEVSEEQFFRRIVRHVVQCWEEVVSKGERLLPIQFWKSYDTGRHLSRQRTETHQIEEIERGVLTKLAYLSLPAAYTERDPAGKPAIRNAHPSDPRTAGPVRPTERRIQKSRKLQAVW